MTFVGLTAMPASCAVVILLRLALLDAVTVRALKFPELAGLDSEPQPKSAIKVRDTTTEEKTAFL